MMNMIRDTPRGYKKVVLMHHDWCDMCCEEIGSHSDAFKRGGNVYCAECLLEWMPLTTNDSNQRNKSKTGRGQLQLCFDGFLMLGR